MGVSEATYYVWKKRYASMGLLEVRELRQLRDENARPKPLVADLTPDRHVQQKVKKRPNNAQTSGHRTMDTGLLPTKHTQGLQAELPQEGTWYYRSQARDSSVLRQRMRELAAARPRFGYERLHILLTREVWRVGRNRVHRMYKLEGLQVRGSSSHSTVD
jgi:hypothetical protein